jgi:predicted TIM-barrel fold metal-dependent hydrolase
MAEPPPATIDCDAHCAPGSIDDLLPYFDEYWRGYVADAGVQLSPTTGGAYPPGAATTGGPAPGNAAALTDRVLDGHGSRYAILNCLSAFDTSRNAYFEAALTRAINDWLRAEWLDRDERLRASIVVPPLDVEAAVEEIERVGSDRRFVQVLLPVRSDARYGQRRYHPIYEAAEQRGLAIGLHAWGRTGNAPTGSGFTHNYTEDYLANSQVIVQAQLTSLVSEGVFDRFPKLRVALLECGFSWLPFLLWRLDKDWKAVWREVPWLKSKPSDYVYRHFRATTEPAQLPADPIQVAEAAELVRARDFLMFASDYPHDHGNGGEALLDALDDDGKDAVLRGNAAHFYSLEA